MDKDLNIFIPAVNRKKLVLETLQSLPIQGKLNTNLNLKVTILGRSTDGTKEIIKRNYGSKVKIVDEVDKGLYDALGKNLPKVKDSYVTWLGAGDKWHENAITVIEHMILTKKLWFTGRPTIIDSSGQKFHQLKKVNYDSRLIIEGYYNGHLPFIQQESTIWHSNLHKYIDWNKFRNLEYAGDYYLWSCFAKYEELYCCNNSFAGWRIHKNSLSDNKDAYKKEIEVMTSKTIKGRILYNIYRFRK
jgi:hypothetical protein